MDEASRLANELWKSIYSRYSFLKRPSLEVWADDIDKLNRIDGYDWHTIEVVMNWSQQDSFWRQQIRSGKNLRKHFEKLLIKIMETEASKDRIYEL